MASGPHRPGFYAGVLVAGFIAGGFAHRASPAVAAGQRGQRPSSPAPGTANFGPVSADLLVINFTLGPVGLHVSLLSLIGVVVAYLIARSIF